MFELLFKYSRETFERGEFLFASGWPLWLLVFLIVASGAAIGVSLVRNRHDFSWPKLAVLGVMQLVVWGGLLTMLWRPALLTQTLRPQENAIAMLVDTSASMSYGEGGRSRLQEAAAVLENGPLAELGERFDIELLSFAGETRALESMRAVPAPGRSTDIGQALLSSLRGASAGALAAIVLVSDGGDNSGELDAARIAEIASFGVPVHTLGVGREVIDEDIELTDVVIAPRSSPGATISAQVSIRHGRAANAQLKVYDGEAILKSETIRLPNQAGVTTRWIDIDVGSAGIRDLRFALDPVAGETNLVNNTQRRPVEVPERRRSVLYLEGEPRWEYKFMRRAIDGQEAIRLASLLRTTPNKFYRQGLQNAEELEGGPPTDEETLFAYDAVIIGSYEAAAFTAAQQEMLKEFVSRRGGSLLMIAGPRGLSDGGWGASALAEVLPAALPTQIEQPTFIRYPAKAQLPAGGSLSPVIRLEADDDANARSWAEMPEIKDFQTLQERWLKPGHEILLEADFQGQRRPLLIRHRYGQGQSWILATGGTWAWQMGLPHEDQRHETFWRQLFQAMTASVPTPVTLTTERVYYADQAAVTLRADVRDKTYHPAAGAAVELAIDAPAAARRTVTMEPVPGVPGRYEATVDAAAAGIYRFEAEAKLGDESLGRSRAAVRREDGVSEHFNVQQNRPLLERIAAATGGRYFTLAAAAGIPEAVQYSPAGITERRVLELWNMPALFLLLLLFKAGEWIMRLRWGRL